MGSDTVVVLDEVDEVAASSAAQVNAHRAILVITHLNSSPSLLLTIVCKTDTLNAICGERLPCGVNGVGEVPTHYFVRPKLVVGCCGVVVMLLLVGLLVGCVCSNERTSHRALSHSGQRVVHSPPPPPSLVTKVATAYNVVRRQRVLFLFFLCVQSVGNLLCCLCSRRGSSNDRSARLDLIHR